MHFQQVTIKGMLMGVSPLTDFKTQEVVGGTLDLGSRNESGRFVTNSIKVLGGKLTDFTAYLEEVVIVELTDVTVVSYTNGNRTALSVKAQQATMVVG